MTTGNKDERTETRSCSQREREDERGRDQDPIKNGTVFHMKTTIDSEIKLFKDDSRRRKLNTRRSDVQDGRSRFKHAKVISMAWILT